MGLSVVSSGIKGSANGSSVTTDAIDTSGANLIVLSCSFFLGSDPAISDSKGNAWTALTRVDSGGAATRLYYCASPAVGTGHTFTAGSATIPGLAVLALSGAAASPFVSQSTNFSSSAASIQPGSLTPSEDGSILVTGLNCVFGTTPSVDSSFTALAAGYVGSQHTGTAFAYLLESSAAAKNPTWSWNTTNAASATQAVFKSSVGPATTATLTGPASGYSGVAGAAFAVALDGNYTGTITPATSGTGTFSPSSLAWAGTAENKTFTYTPSSASGSPHSISISGSPSLTLSGSPVSHAVAASTIIDVGDANWFFSPYNWLKTGTTNNRSNNPGAYFKARFTGGTCAITLDLSHLSGTTANQFPAVSWQLDGGAKNRVQLVDGQTIIDLGSSLGGGSHDLFFQVVGAYFLGERWFDPVQSVKVTGLVLASGQTLSAPSLYSKRMLIFGDSHGEGYEALASGATVANQDAGEAYGNILGTRFACEYGVIAFASQAYETVSGGFYRLVDTWNYYWNGQSRLSAGLFSPAPNYIVSCEGDNDTAQASLSTTVASLIGAWRTAAPRAKIFICVPPNDDAEGKVSYLAAGVTSSEDSGTHFIETGENVLGTYHNGSHLSIAGQSRYALLIGDIMAPLLVSRGGAGGRIVIGIRV